MLSKLQHFTLLDLASNILPTKGLKQAKERLPIMLLRTIKDLFLFCVLSIMKTHVKQWTSIWFNMGMVFEISHLLSMMPQLFMITLLKMELCQSNHPLKYRIKMAISSIQPLELMATQLILSSRERTIMGYSYQVITLIISNKPSIMCSNLSDLKEWTILLETNPI